MATPTPFNSFPCQSSLLPPSFRYMLIYGIVIEPQQHERNREKKNIISKIITMLKAKERGENEVESLHFILQTDVVHGVDSQLIYCYYQSIVFFSKLLLFQRQSFDESFPRLQVHLRTVVTVYRRSFLR